MQSPWPSDGLEEKSLQVSDPRDEMRCPRNCSAVTARMGVKLRECKTLSKTTRTVLGFTFQRK